jgi:tetratricopeptide (TPR) repeat protein
MPSDRGLSINFNAGDVGAFTLSDITEYFALLCKKLSYQPPLPKVTEEQAKRILDITQGVPLAIKIAAGLYLETANIDIVTEHVEGKREIVDQMVHRYLLHTHTRIEERARLYGLALLRRADQPTAIAAALGLTQEQARTSYSSELSRLHRRYSFVFTEKEEPALHEEVRHFLRLWIQEHRKEPEIISINQRLKEVHETVLKDLEEQLQYSILKERLQDDEWVGVYLDLTEQQFWIDPVEGVRYALPFMIAAAIYRRDINEDTSAIGQFFEWQVRQPYRDWWTWATQSLVYTTSHDPGPEELTGLEELAKLANERCPTFSRPLPDFRKELEAALWWRLGESHRGEDENKALEWYERALSRLDNEIELREAATNACYEVSMGLYDERKYTECIRLLNRAVELKSDYTTAYILRGIAYRKLKEYGRAIQDYDRAIELDRTYASAYYSHIAYNARGNAYRKLKEYERAIQDHDRAIELDRSYASAYYNRGLAYLWLKKVSQARDNYIQSYELDSTGVNAAWMAEWVGMSKQRPGIEEVVRLEAIAALDPERYVAYVCRGVALGLGGKVKEGLEEVEKAFPLNPQEWDAYFWRGMLLAYYYRGQLHIEEAMTMIEQSLTVGLPPQLLIPLYWLEKDLPDLFVKYARTLLLRYDV